MDKIPACCDFSANLSTEFLTKIQSNEAVVQTPELKKIVDDLKVKFDSLNDQKTPAMDTWVDSLNVVADWESVSAWRAHKNPMTEGSA